MGILVAQVEAQGLDHANATTAGPDDSGLPSTTLAASTLIMTFVNAVSFVFFSPLFAVGIRASRDQGRITDLREKNEAIKEHEAALIDEKKDGQEEKEEGDACDVIVTDGDDTVAEKDSESRLINARIISNNREIEDLTLNIAALNGAGLTLAVLLSLVPVLLFSYSGAILKLAGQADDVCNTVQSFMGIYAAAPPGLFVRVAIEQLILVHQGEAHAMYMAWPPFLIGLALSICLSQGYGFPNMGVPGIAVGCVVEAYLTPIAYGVYLARRKNLQQFNFFNFLRVKSKILGQMKEILKDGWPISLSFVNEGSVSVLLLIFAAALGPEALADLNSETQAFFFILDFSAAFGQVAYLNISQLIGGNHFEAANLKAKHDLATTAIWTAPLCVIAAAILNQTEGYPSEIADVLQTVFAVAIFLDSLRYVGLTIQRGLKDNIPSTALSAVGLWLGLLASGLLMLESDANVLYLGAGYLAGEVAALLALLIRAGILIDPKRMAARLTSKRKSDCCRFWGRKKQKEQNLPKAIQLGQEVGPDAQIVGESTSDDTDTGPGRPYAEFSSEEKENMQI